MNLVCGPEGRPTGVLLRGGRVVEGVELAHQRRPKARSERDLARGPARLAEVLGVGRAQDGADVCGDGPVVLCGGVVPPAAALRRGPRVGLRQAAQFPWRFWIADDPTVSAYRPHVPKRATG
jgi:DNA-3-methyladenine glycosylase